MGVRLLSLVAGKTNTFVRHSISIKEWRGSKLATGEVTSKLLWPFLVSPRGPPPRPPPINQANLTTLRKRFSSDPHHFVILSTFFVCFMLVQISWMTSYFQTFRVNTRPPLWGILSTGFTAQEKLSVRAVYISQTIMIFQCNFGNSILGTCFDLCHSLNYKQTLCCCR